MHLAFMSSFSIPDNSLTRIFSKTDQKEATFKLTGLQFGGGGFFRRGVTLMWSEDLVYFGLSWTNNLVNDRDYYISFEQLPTHTHTVANITDFPLTIAPSAHTHVKTEITDFAHNHAWNDITNQPTSLESGFDNPVNVTINYDGTNRQVTLTGSFIAYWNGTPIASLTNGWVSDAHPDTPGSWFLYYNGASFIWSNVAWTMDMVQISFVYYHPPSSTFALRECHGGMP